LSPFICEPVVTGERSSNGNRSSPSSYARMYGHLVLAVKRLLACAFLVSIDYYGRWKALHYAVKKAYQNILISPVVEKEFFRVYVVSDELKPIQAEMILSIKDFSGKELWTNTQKIELSENTSKIYFQTPLEELLKGMDKRKIVCFAQLFVDNKSIADHYFYFTDIKNLELPKPKITLRTDKDMIVITTDLFAKDIYLQSDKADVSFQ